ncbi:MAG: CdaR family protein [Bacillota bacterium]
MDVLDRWLEKDLTLKILAVVLAIVLWLRVGSGQSPVVSVTMSGVTVQAVGLPSELAVAEIRPQKVDATVRAPRSVLDRLSPDTVRAEVDLSGAGAGQFSLPVAAKAPRGVQVVEVSPTYARVTVDYLAERRVPVQVQVVGVVGEDYRVESPLPSPAEVLACGPRGQVAQVRYAVGEVDVTGATADFSRTVNLRAVDRQGREIPGVTLKPGGVEVRFSLVRLPPAREVPVQANVQGQLPAGYRLREVVVSPSRVKVRGSQDKLDTLESVSTRPISLEGITGDSEREVAVALPTGIVMADPPTVLVYLRVVEDVGEKEFPGLTVAVRNLPEGMTASCQPAQVKVTVRARKDLLEGVQPQAWVDGSGDAGERKVTVQVDVPSRVEVVRVEPAEVTLVTATR